MYGLIKKEVSVKVNGVTLISSMSTLSEKDIKALKENGCTFIYSILDERYNYRTTKSNVYFIYQNGKLVGKDYFTEKHIYGHYVDMI